LIELQHKIDGQSLTGPSRAKHLDPDDPSEFPVPVLGDHDLEPPANTALFRPPSIERD
jgi:NADH-quinone oxidoreductase subunit B